MQHNKTIMIFHFRYLYNYEHKRANGGGKGDGCPNILYYTYKSWGDWSLDLFSLVLPPLPRRHTHAYNYET